MLTHVVMFTFKEETTTDDVAGFQTAVSRLADEVPYLHDLRHGPDLGERATNAGYGLIGEFNTVEDFYAYLEHPAHKQLIDSSVAPLCSSWRSVQFVTD